MNAYRYEHEYFFDHNNRYERFLYEMEPDHYGSNEIHVAARGSIHKYISFGSYLLECSEEPTTYIKAMGNAIPRAVKVANILKRKIRGVSQQTITSTARVVEVCRNILDAHHSCPIQCKQPVDTILIVLWKGTDDAGGAQTQEVEDTPTQEALIPSTSGQARFQEAEEIYLSKYGKSFKIPANPSLHLSSLFVDDLPYVNVRCCKYKRHTVLKSVIFAVDSHAMQYTGPTF